VIGLLLFVSVALHAQDGGFAPFEQFAEKQMARDRVVGLSVAVLDGDKLWTRGFGHADLENKVKATEKSSYRMASVTKPMTAVAALKLAEQGKLDLDADIRRYVPYFPDKGKTITTRQLLSHLGGISHYRNYEIEGNIRDPKTTREAIAIFEKFDLVSEPGSAYTYSSYGYNLIGAVIEGATGRSYREVMQELVWTPAGMSSTRVDSPTDLIPYRVTGYRLDDGEIKRSDFVDISSRFAGGGTRSTVVDMVRFAEAIWDGRLLAKETVEKMWWPAQTTAGRFINYGLGFNAMPVNGHYYASHSGSQQEARTLLMIWPERELAIAFASNFEDTDFDPYRLYLYWLITAEVWTDAPYASDRNDRLAISIANRLIDSGGFYFEKYGRPMTTDAAALRRAFEYVNNAYRSASKDPAAAQKLIADGIHPSSGSPLIVAGSWIASKIGEYDAREGALAAVSRYNSSSQRYRLDPALARRQAELATAWRAVWTDDARRLIVDPPAGDAYARALEAYRGLRIAPNHVARLVQSVEMNFDRGNLAVAEAHAKVAAELYGEDDAATAVYGIALAAKGDASGAEMWLRRSAAANPNGYASPRRLAAIAREIAQMGKPEAGATLLAAAQRVYPAAEELKKR
jgi:CubicO group peptidase (beta-lactamase class C family)